MPRINKVVVVVVVVFVTAVRYLSGNPTSQLSPFKLLQCPRCLACSHYFKEVQDAFLRLCGSFYASFPTEV